MSRNLNGDAGVPASTAGAVNGSTSPEHLDIVNSRKRTEEATVATDRTIG